MMLNARIELLILISVLLLPRRVSSSSKPTTQRGSWGSNKEQTAAPIRSILQWSGRTQQQPSTSPDQCTDDLVGLFVRDLTNATNVSSATQICSALEPATCQLVLENVLYNFTKTAQQGCPCKPPPSPQVNLLHRKNTRTVWHPYMPWSQYQRPRSCSRSHHHEINQSDLCMPTIHASFCDGRHVRCWCHYTT